MATTGTITESIRTGYQMKLVWTVDSQSVTNNTSTVTAKVQLVSTGSSYTINSTASKSGSLTINGTKYTFSFTASLSGNQTKTIFTKTVNITHNADGSKTVAFSATAGIEVTLSGTYYGNITASGNGTFNTIPRATTPTVSASSVDMGASITINMPRASSDFDHTLTYTFGSATGTIGSDLGTSRAWTVPLSLASQIPNGTSGTCTITCKTYNGSTLIGTKTVTFTAKVPASVVPTISSVAVADTMTAIYSFFGNMVQGKSKPKFTITAAGAYGSTIKSYSTEFETKTYTGSTPTTSVLTGSGTRSAKITVTDSRGRTATTTKTFTALAYTPIKVQPLHANRSDANGTFNDEGAYLTVNLEYAIASVGGKNTSGYSLQYKEASATSWTTLESGAGLTLKKTVTSANAVLNVDKQYQVRLQVTDYFGTVTSNIVSIGTAFTLMDFHSSGTGMAFGMVSQKANAVEFGLPALFNHGETPEGSVVLTSNTDCNSLLTSGFYCFSSAVRATLLNMPVTSGSGGLVTIDMGEAGQKMQIAVKCSEASEIWERMYFSNAWKPWKKIYTGQGKILWSGGMYMTGGHKITLPEPISLQPNGIVLVFSRYASGAVADTNFHSFFVSKVLVSEKNGVGHTFTMTATPTFELMAAKYLYINNDSIVGHDNNSATGTSSTTGITYANNTFVLRYVIGV